MHMKSSDIGKRIRKARTEKGWTQENLADVLNVTPTHISHIETSKSGCSVDMVIQIMNALEITPNELFCGVAAKTGPEMYSEFAELLSQLEPDMRTMFYRQLELWVDMKKENTETNSEK